MKIKSEQGAWRRHLTVGESQMVTQDSITMALYLSVVLLALIIGFGDSRDVSDEVALLVGTAIGLGIAHIYAFLIASRVINRGSVEREDVLSAFGISLAVAVVTAVTVMPYVLFGDKARPSVVSGWTLVAVIAMTSYLAARASGASRKRSAWLGFAIGALTLGIAAMKATVLPH